MDKVQKYDDNNCNILSSEPLRVELVGIWKKTGHSTLERTTQKSPTKNKQVKTHRATLAGLVVSVFATGRTVAGSGLAEDGGYLWMIKIRSAHFLRRGSKAVGPMS
jgi:hypothetical protein